MSHKYTAQQKKENKIKSVHVYNFQSKKEDRYILKLRYQNPSTNFPWTIIGMLLFFQKFPDFQPHFPGSEEAPQLLPQDHKSWPNVGVHHLYGSSNQHNQPSSDSLSRTTDLPNFHDVVFLYIPSQYSIESQLDWHSD